MDIVTLSIFAGALAISAGSPGPSIAALVSRVLQRGWRGVLPFLAAMWMGEAIWLSLAVFGLATVAQTFHLAFALIKYAGIFYLLYLAWRIWSEPVNAEANGLPRPDAPLKMFFAGLTVTLGNPKIMVFYLALLPTLLNVETVSMFAWLELVGVMFAVLMAIDLGWVVFASAARTFLKSPSAMRATNKISASLMAGAAALIAVRD